MENNQVMAGCTKCPIYHEASLKRLGVQADNWDYLIALAGNPNTGKSTVFNALTGLRQHVGNWPGKTVARVEGAYSYKGAVYKLVDLPGTYSLLSTSSDEEIARDFILFGQPSVTVVVIDATRLERNLNLTLQILEITDKVVVALNLMDEAERHGLEIDTRHLARRLGVPVVPLVARRREGIPDLLDAIENIATGAYPLAPHRIKQNDGTVETSISELSQMLLDQYPGLPNSRWVALRLLEGDENIAQALREGTLGHLNGSKV